MIDNDGIKAMMARQQKIAEQVTALQRENAEIAEALKILKRYSNEPALKNAGKATTKRPEGIPTTFEMAKAVLQEAGSSGLKGGEMVRAIEKRFWPGVQRMQILPAIYGFAKKEDGRLKKENGRFYVAKMS
jgi:hypothetical protein